MSNVQLVWNVVGFRQFKHSYYRFLFNTYNTENALYPNFQRYFHLIWILPGRRPGKQIF